MRRFIMEDETIDKIVVLFNLLYILFCIVFIALKAFEVITFSWVWVLAPIWIPVAVIIATCVSLLIVYIIKDLIDSAKEDKNK